MKTSGKAGMALSLLSVSSSLYGCAEEGEQNTRKGPEKALKISLAQWSLHRAHQDGKMTNLDFPAMTKDKFGIEAVEYVSRFMVDGVKDKAYLDQLNRICSDKGVTQLLIMVDDEGHLAATNDDERKKAVENHYKWVEAAKFLGCHSIRVNSYGEGSASDVQSAAVDGLGTLATFAKDYDINVIVENHGGYSSHGQWLAGVMNQINMSNCGTLPDFGNFCLKHEDGKCVEEYDRYQGVEELLPFAKAVSAKSNDFNAQGHETKTDFSRMIRLVRDSGYQGYIGIEYEGHRLSEEEGIMATKALLEKVI